VTGEVQVQVGDLDMTVVVEGAGPDLVLLHGGGEGAEGLAELRGLLVAGGHRVIAPEQRAHGHTPGMAPLTYEAMAADTAALLDRLEVRGADIVGWSDGGILGLLLARDRPDLVRRLVPIGANAAIDSDPTPVASEAFDWFEQVDPETVPLAVPVEWRRDLFGMWRAGPHLPIGDLARIAAPVLLVSADRDLVSLEHTAAMLAALPDGRLAVIPGTHHDVPRTHPAIVAGLVEDFLVA
jgi:pimeloyl-ACP methyl ester carboxylesterase